MPEINTEPIVGRNPVFEVIRAGRRRVNRLLLAEGVQAKGNLDQALALAHRAGTPVVRVPRAELDRAYVNHQGVVALAEPYPYVDLAAIVARARGSGEPPLILVLDAIQDPENFGTLLRTAEAVGVDGVVIPARHQVGVTPAVISASAGACEHLWIAQANLAQALRALKEAGLWIAGLERSPEAVDLEDVDLSRPLGLVVGSEGEGLRRLVRQGCDYLIRLRMRGRVTSLNAAVAGSIVLYRAWESRGFNMAPAPAP